MSKMNRTCCFTGRRPKDLCGYDHNAYKEFTKDLVASLETLYADGVRTFISGGAQGFDQLAFWAVEIFKKQHDDVQNIVYVPFCGQENRWKEDGAFGQSEYNKMLKKADQVVFLQENLSDYREISKALMDRNKKMVDASDIVVALYPDMTYRENTGGTAHCMRYAEENDKPICQIEYKIENSKLNFNKMVRHNYHEKVEDILPSKKEQEHEERAVTVRFTDGFANNFSKGDVITAKLIENDPFNHYKICNGNIVLTTWPDDLFAEALQHCEILDDPYDLAKPYLEEMQKAKKNVAVSKESELDQCIEVLSGHESLKVLVVPFLEELKERRAFEHKLMENFQTFCKENSPKERVMGTVPELIKQPVKQQPVKQSKIKNDGEWINMAEELSDILDGYDDLDID